MSILLKLKSKLQDPSLYEAKIREFDECLSLLKSENVELHKRIDQLEASCQTSVSTRPGHSLEEHVRQLQRENGRLSAENQCQRQEYEQFLDQLTKMVVRTAVMQENIRQECASIYDVIEQLATSTNNEAHQNPSLELIIEARKEDFSWSHFNQNSQSILDYQKISKFTDSLISPQPSSSLSNSSSTAHCSVQSADSWTCDPRLLISVKSTEAQRPQDLQRSETFTITRVPPEVSSSSPRMIVPNSNVENYPMTRTMPTTTMSSALRPSRLPSRCSTLKTQLSNNNNTTTSNRSLSTQKESKLPIRTASTVNRQPTLLQKPTISISTGVTAKKNMTIASNRSLTAAPNTSVKKTVRPPLFVQVSSNKTRSRSSTTVIKNNSNTHIPSLINKHTRTTTEAVKSNEPVEQRNSTSSESSMEEQRQMNQLLPLLQDEGYSTWSSVDVKEDAIASSIKTHEMDDRQRTIGLVESWLDTSTRQFLKKPVNEVQADQVEELSISPSFLCPFVRNRYPNETSIPFSSPSISSSNKDISLDSLDSPRSKEQTIMSSSSSSSSSSTFSRSETFEKLLLTQTLPNIIDDLADSTSSTSSTFNMSEYIEDHFIDQEESSTSSSSTENSISFETTVMNSHISVQPQKRLLFPGLLNRLICIRRVLSDSDLQRKRFYITENENPSHVYHSNVINEHSVEVNLINTYGSDTELHVWSHDCAEQRRFLNERQQQQQHQEHFSDEIITQSDDIEQIALERQILLQQIYEYPWLLQENDLDRTGGITGEQTLRSPSSHLIVPSPNPDFYQLCTLTNSSSFIISYDPNTRHTVSPVPSSVL